MSNTLPSSLCAAALDVLTTASPHEKCNKTRRYVYAWRMGDISALGKDDGLEAPDRPARPDRPELRPPSEMPRRAKAGSLKSKTALLHALAHIELNAVDLSWDIILRAFDLGDFSLPREFFDDWAKVADDEAKHFLMLDDRLQILGAGYGDLPAHDGLWEASERTAHDFAARLAIVPMVLEARGLDVTPNMIAMMQKQHDFRTADMLQIIHDDEITHVRAGTVWFEAWCAHHGKTVDETWQDLVRTYFNGKLKRPFNDPSRFEAGMLKHWYDPLADEMEAQG